MNSYKFAFKILSIIFFICSLVAVAFCSSSVSNREVIMILYPLGVAIFFKVCDTDEK
jgi:hypothetical protein